MSDTPRTDAMETALLWRTGEVLQSDVEFANFARDLERENAALRKDKERLDWLEECHGWPEYIDAEWHFGGEVFSSHRAAIDAAIDAARAKEAKP